MEQKQKKPVAPAKQGQVEDDNVLSKPPEAAAVLAEAEAFTAKAKAAEEEAVKRAQPRKVKLIHKTSSCCIPITTTIEREVPGDSPLNNGDEVSSLARGDKILNREYV